MKRLIFPLFGLFSTTFYGQIAPDTHMFEQMYALYEASPIFLSEAPVDNFTFSSLYLNHKEGDLHFAQEAKEQTDFGLRSYGFYQHKRINFFGKINLQRIYQKDKAWTLSEEEIQPNGLMPDPHYFAVSRPAPWVNQQYHIFGGAGIPIYKQLWDMTLSTRINYEEKFRENYDPRPKTNHNELYFAAQTAFRLLDKHKIALSGEYGYNKASNKIKFSDQEGQTPNNFTKYNRWQLGLGTFQLPPNSDYRRNNDYYGFSLGYHFASDKHKFLAEGSYRNTLTHTYRNDNDSEFDEDILARLYEDTFLAKIHYINQLKKEQLLSLSLIASDKQASNRLIQRQGRNYRSYQEDIAFSANLLKQLGETHRELALEAVYQGAYQKDVTAKTLTDHSSLALSLFWAKGYELDHFVLRPSLKASLISPLYNKLINENEDYHKAYNPDDYAARTLRLFYQEVIYPDYAYFDSTRYLLDLGIDFKKRLSKGTQLITSLHSTYHTAFKGAERYGATISISLLK